MQTSAADLSEIIAAQATQVPSMYGRVDFSITPERFAAAPNDVTELAPEFLSRRAELLANEELVALIKAYTMHGDPLADAYAALIPVLGFKKLSEMIEAACDGGVESVPEAPPELARLIEDMERSPSWIDMALVERGAWLERNGYASRSPYLIRGGFIGTFMNKYSALPMAVTGTLSTKTAAHRVHETATFFTTTFLPGALERHGAGFKAAAVVRFMHSMVRFNALHREGEWDVKTYGIPIPQTDQMPVALLPVLQLSLNALRRPGAAFTRDEQAHVALTLYRGALLGLPKGLLPQTPRDIVDTFLTRHATLRKATDETCDALVRATMAADLMPTKTPADRVRAWLEHGFSRVYFLAKFARGDKRAAANVGVRVGIVDRIAALMTILVMTTTVAIYAIAEWIPFTRDAADRALVRKLSRPCGQTS